MQRRAGWYIGKTTGRRSPQLAVQLADAGSGGSDGSEWRPRVDHWRVESRLLAVEIGTTGVISLRSGSRLPAGRHFTTLAMKTCSRAQPIDRRSSSRARPPVRRMGARSRPHGPGTLPHQSTSLSGFPLAGDGPVPADVKGGSECSH